MTLTLRLVITTHAVLPPEPAFRAWLHGKTRRHEFVWDLGRFQHRDEAWRFGTEKRDELIREFDRALEKNYVAR